MDTVLFQYHFDWNNFLYSFIPIVIGLFFFFLWKLYPLKNSGTQQKGAKGHKTYVIMKYLGWCLGSLVMLLGVLVVTSYLYQYQTNTRLLRTNDVKVVEGVVADFHPEPKEEHDTEHFQINGVYFEYAAGDVSNYYHTPAFAGGVITKNGQHLRVNYVQKTDGTNGILYIAEVH